MLSLVVTLWLIAFPVGDLAMCGTYTEPAWEGWSYLILSVTPEGVAGTRSWRLREGAFVEEVIEP